ncbi:MAG: peptidylprolyl isomerase [Nanoarchaeota archaeon]|nr:peptidylprolyl isomerase [Nanoarchaeota archaeon]
MEKNDFVRIKYDAKIKEGSIEFDKSEDMPLVVGANWVMKPIDDALLSMKVSEKKTIEILPEQGYGPRDVKMIKTIPLAEFKKHGQKPVPGMIMNMDNKAGKILSVTGGRVKVDLNHPLAGKTLIFNLEITEKIEGPENKIRMIIEWFIKPRTGPDVQLLKDIKITIVGKEVELDLPPLVSLNSMYKKKISEDVTNLLDMESVKYVEIFKKPTALDKKKIEELNAKLPVTEINN